MNEDAQFRAIVCGAGEVGRSIARHLAEEEAASVTLIAQEAELLDRARRDTAGIETLRGHPAHPPVLREAGADNANLLVAVTRSDEINMVACQVAHSVFSIRTRIARVSNPAYQEEDWPQLYGRNDLPAEIIVPEREVAIALSRLVALPGASDAVGFVGGRVQLIGMKLDHQTPVLSHPLRELTELFPELHARVVYIVRDGLGIVPRKDETLIVGDEVFVVTEANRVNRVLRSFGREIGAPRRILIVGGGNLGRLVAQRIAKQESAEGVTVLEADPNIAQQADEILDGMKVLLGDPRDDGVLEEAGVSDVAMLLALTENDEVNTLVSALAKQKGCPYAATVTHDSKYGSLLSQLGIDQAIVPRSATVSKILRWVRRGRVQAVHTLHDGRAEVMDYEALDTSNIAGTSLRNLKLDSDIAIGAIVRDGEVILPVGDTVIRPGDRVIVLVTHEKVQALEAAFGTAKL